MPSMIEDYRDLGDRNRALVDLNRIIDWWVRTENRSAARVRLALLGEHGRQWAGG